MLSSVAALLLGLPTLVVLAAQIVAPVVECVSRLERALVGGALSLHDLVNLVSIFLQSRFGRCRVGGLFIMQQTNSIGAQTPSKNPKYASKVASYQSRVS